MKIARPFDRKGEGDGSVVDAPLDATYNGWVANMAINFLKYRTNSQQFMHLGFHNPHLPVGILLCTQNDHTLVEYALAGMDNHLFVSKHQLELPRKEEIQKFLKKKMREVGE